MSPDKERPDAPDGELESLRARVAELEWLLGRSEAIIDLSMDAFVLIDDGGSVREVNSAYCRMLGYRRDELVGKHMSELDIDESPDETRRRIQRIRTIGPERFDARQRGKDGRCVDVEVNAHCLSEHGGTVFAFIRDITRRKAAQETMRRERDLLARIADTSPAGITVLDCDGQITFANRMAERVLGLVKEDITQRSYNDPLWRITDYDGNAFPDDELPFARVMATREPVIDVCHAIEWPDGRRALLSINAAPLLDESGDIHGVVAALNDVTERVLAERALRESMQTSTDIVEAIPSGIFMYQYEPPDRLILIRANPAAEALTGIRGDDWIGREFNEIWPGAADAGVTQAYLQVMRSGEPFDTQALDYADAHTAGVFRIRAFRLPGQRLCVAFENVAELREAALAARDNEERLRTLIDAMPDVVCFKDGDGRWLVSNDFNLRLFGLEGVDYRGKHDRELAEIAPDFAPVLLGCIESDEAAWEQAALWRNDETVTYDDGRVQIFDILKVPIFHPDGSRKGLIVVGRDVTERHQAAEALRQSEARYRTLFDNTGTAMFLLEADGVVSLANDEFSHLCGIPLEEIENRLIVWDIVAPHDVDRLQKNHRERRTAIGNPPKRYEFDLLRPDGQTRRVLISVELLPDTTTSLVSLIDVTERNIAEQALRASEDRYRALVENSPDIVMRFDHEHRHLYASPSVVAVTGIEADEFAGRTHRELGFPEELCTFWESHIQSVFDTGQPVETEFEIRSESGALSINWRLFPEVGEQGRVGSVLTIARDVTDEKRTEEQLQHASKMEAIGRLAGGIAHDFNNLLTAIGGYTDFVADALGAGHQLQADIQQVQKATQRAATLTRQLLAFSRQQVLEPVVVDLNAVVRDMETMLRRLIGEDVRLETVLAPGLGRIMADAGQIGQIVMNLAINSRDAMPSGGVLAIETANVTLDPAYVATRPGVSPGEYVLLSVSDTGRGMDEETRQHVFEPFFTTRADAGGTGLGLATVYGIVKQSGGHIECYSERGHGTVFLVYLPRHRCDVEPHDEPSPDDDAADVGHEMVLLVEDDAVVREFTRRALEMQGFRVMVAETPHEAVALADRHCEQIDILLTDVIMPEMSGRELAETLRERHPSIAILYMSGYTASVIERQGGLDPGVAFINKPFSVREIARKVRQTLDEWDRGGPASAP